MLSSNGSFWTNTTWSGLAPATPVTNQCITGDFNADGMADTVCETGSGTGSWAMALSTGAGWATSYWNNGPAIGTPISNQCMVGDINGDGSTPNLFQGPKSLA